jgi:hypothetical protein
MHVTIATPMYGGQCAGVFAKSLLHATLKLSRQGIDVSFVDLYNESLITRARNTLTHAFLNSESDYLLFIDADQSFSAEDIVRMINHDKDIIAAPVPMKSINWPNVKKAIAAGKEDVIPYTGVFNINFLPGSFASGQIKISEPVEVLYAGTGMMLIKRKVFETIKPLVKSYRYDGTPLPTFDLKTGDEITDYWFTNVVDGRLLSEDYNLCSLWRSQGGSIYVDLLSKVVHVGTYHFSGTLIDFSTLKEVKPEETKAVSKKKAKK